MSQTGYRTQDPCFTSQAPYRLRYAAREMFFEKSCITHIFLAHCSFVLVAIETIMQKKWKKKILKKISPQKSYALFT